MPYSQSLTAEEYIDFSEVNDNNMDDYDKAFYDDINFEEE